MLTIEVPASAPTCVQCEYNLTGLTSERCPECGWVVDWRLAHDEDANRIGSPAYRSGAGAFVKAGLRTTALMLFHPVRFARVMRADEPILPAAFVATSALLVMMVSASWKQSPLFGYALPRDLAQICIAYCPAIVVCILLNMVGFAIVSRSSPGRRRFTSRLRLVLRISLYSTCFVAAWPWTGPPGYFTWSQLAALLPFTPQFYSRASSFGEPGLAAALIFDWWLIILITFAFVRCRPRWRALLLLPIILLAGFAASEVALLIGPP